VRLRDHGAVLDFAVGDDEHEPGRMRAGKTNNEIAAELQISERTARTHVSTILGKLDLTSRTQAALWAVRQGLVEVGAE